MQSSTYYEQPVDCSDPTRRGRLLVALLATTTVVALAYGVASHLSESFRAPAAPPLPRTVLRATPQLPPDTMMRRRAAAKQPKQVARQQGIRATLAAGFMASALQANAAGPDLLSDLSGFEYEAAAPRGDVGAMRKGSTDVFARAFGKAATAPEVKAAPEPAAAPPAPPAAAKAAAPPGDDPFAAFRKAFEAPKEAPPAPAPAPEVKAAPAPAKPPPKAEAEADPFAIFKKALEPPKAPPPAPPAVVAVPQPEPPKAAVKAEAEADPFAIFKKALEPPKAPPPAPPAVVAAPQLEPAKAAVKVEAPAEAADPFAAFRKAFAPPKEEAPAPAAPAVKTAPEPPKAEQPKPAPKPEVVPPKAAPKPAPKPDVEPPKPAPKVPPRVAINKPDPDLVLDEPLLPIQPQAPVPRPEPRQRAKPKVVETPKVAPKGKAEDALADFLSKSVDEILAPQKVEPPPKPQPAPPPPKPAPKEPVAKKTRQPKAPPAPRPTRAPQAPKADGAPGSGGPPLVGIGAAGLGATGLAAFLTRRTGVTRSKAKQDVLDAIAGADRGFDSAASTIDAAIKALERQSPTPAPLKSPLLDGRWELLYSTAPRVLGGGKPGGKAVAESFDTAAKTYRLEPGGSGLSLFGSGGVTATFEAVDGKTAVLAKGPGSARGSTRGSVRGTGADAGRLGSFTVTYLDDAWRVTRDGPGEVSVFRRPGARDEAAGDADEEEARPLAPARPASTRSASTRSVSTRSASTRSTSVRSSASKRGTFFSSPTAEDEDDDGVEVKKAFSLPKFGRPFQAKTPAPVEDDEEAAPGPKRQPFAMPKFGLPSKAPVATEEDEEAPSQPKSKPFAMPKFGLPFQKQSPSPPEEEEDRAPQPTPKPFEMPKFGRPFQAPAPPEADDEDAPTPPPQSQTGFRAPAFPTFGAPKAPSPAAEDEPEAQMPPETPRPGLFFGGFTVPTVPQELGSLIDQIQRSPDTLKSLTTPPPPPPPPTPVDPLEAAKTRLFRLLEGTDRGLSATVAEADTIEAAVQAVEALNPTAAPITSPLINGQWELLYTTSETVLGKDKPAFLRPKGPIYQYIDTALLRAYNEQTVKPVEALPAVTTAVSADLTALSDRKLAVRFEQFRFGPVKVDAAKDANATLDVTFLDAGLRISRGSQGNVFVLRMADPARTQPAAP